MGIGYSVHHASCLAAHMPPDSALYAAIEPANEWGASEYLLAQIDYDIRCLSWGLAGGKKSKSPQPKRIETPAQRKPKTDYTRDDMDEIADALGIPKDRR